MKPPLSCNESVDDGRAGGHAVAVAVAAVTVSIGNQIVEVVGRSGNRASERVGHAMLGKGTDKTRAMPCFID